GARAAVNGPASRARGGAAVGVVDRDAGVRVADGRDVGLHALGAAGVLLEGGLRDVLAATAAARVPGALGPAARARRLGQAGAAAGHDMGAGGRILDAVAAVAGADRDEDSGVVEVLRVGCGDGRILASAVAVGDGGGAHRDGGVHGRAEIIHR